MTGPQEMHTAMVNRSIRTIKAELEFLTDAAVITPQTLNDLLSAIPEQTALRAPISVGAVPAALPTAGTPQFPSSFVQSLSLNEKPPPPPAYGASPAAAPPPLAQATALYEYRGEDDADLYLQPNDHIAVTEYTNAEWWRGRSLRTGREGIFPRSYVRVVDEKMPMPGLANNYGNMPLQISGVGNGTGEVPSKHSAMGKKIGGKLGNAVVFGAGASIGSNIVNSIL